MYQQILIATDGSALSEQAVQHGIALASATQAQITVIKVVSLYPQSYLEDGVAFNVQKVEEIERRWADEAQALVDQVCVQAQATGVKAKGVIAKSDLVGESIIAAAKRHQCDLIVMASHGRRGFKRLLMGSETLHVLTHSHIPVLVLRQTEDEARAPAQG